MPSTTGRRSASSSCAPPRPMNCRCAPSAISSACSSGWSDSSCCRWCLSGVTLTAWRGYRRGDAVAILLSTAVIVPFAYFFWKSLTLAGRRYLADVHVAGRICRRRHQHRDAAARRVSGMDDQIDHLLGQCGDRFRHRLRRSGVSLLCRLLPGISSARPIRSAARRAIEQVVDRAQAELQKTGATWIATTDYRTYAMLRWYFNGRVPVIQINERGRFMGFRDPGMNVDQGSRRALCRARAGQYRARCGRRRRRSGSRWSGSIEAGAGS